MSPGFFVLRETGDVVVDAQGSVLDPDLSRESTVDRVEIEQVCGALEAALDLVDVGESKFRMLAHALGPRVVRFFRTH